jgi:hypothetical protein
MEPIPERIKAFVEKFNLLAKSNVNVDHYYQLFICPYTGIVYFKSISRERYDSVYYFQEISDGMLADLVNSTDAIFDVKVVMKRSYEPPHYHYYLYITINECDIYSVAVNQTGYYCWSLFGKCHIIPMTMGYGKALGDPHVADAYYRGKIVRGFLYYGVWEHFVCIGDNGIAANICFNRPPTTCKSMPTTIHKKVSLSDTWSVCVPTSAFISASNHLAIVITNPTCVYFSPITIMFMNELNFVEMKFDPYVDFPIELIGESNKSLGRFAILTNYEKKYFLLNSESGKLISFETDGGKYYNRFGIMTLIDNNTEYMFNEKGATVLYKRIYSDLSGGSFMYLSRTYYFDALWKISRSNRTKPAINRGLPAE